MRSSKSPYKSTRVPGGCTASGLEVLPFTTHANSGKMPGLLPSLNIGELFIGPITAISRAKERLPLGGRFTAVN
jgi:hypothetical protein